MKYKIPMPPIGELVEFDDAPPSKEDLLALQKLHKESDMVQIRIVQQRLVGLGYEASWEQAEKVFRDPALHMRVSDEWHELESQHRLHDMISGVEQIARERGLNL